MNFDYILQQCISQITCIASFLIYIQNHISFKKSSVHEINLLRCSTEKQIDKENKHSLKITFDKYNPFLISYLFVIHEICSSLLIWINNCDLLRKTISLYTHIFNVTAIIFITCSLLTNHEVYSREKSLSYKLLKLLVVKFNI